MTAPSDDMNDLESDIRHLSDLIDIIADMSLERDARFYPGHVDSLIWIARDLAANNVAAVKACHTQGDGRRQGKKGGAVMISHEEIDRLIAAHKAALAEHDRLFHLNDHGKINDAAVYVALEPIDDALVALCRARPRAPDNAKLRRDYLASVLPGAVYGMPSFTQEVFDALLAGERT